MMLLRLLATMSACAVLLSLPKAFAVVSEIDRQEALLAAECEAPRGKPRGITGASA